MSVSEDLDRRFREAAAAAGLVDAAYDLADTPIGTLLVATTDQGVLPDLVRPDRGLDELSESVGRRVLGVPRRIDEARRELDEYFEGRRTEFDLPLDIGRVAEFHRIGWTSSPSSRTARSRRTARWPRRSGIRAPHGRSVS